MSKSNTFRRIGSAPFSSTRAHLDIYSCISCCVQRSTGSRAPSDIYALPMYAEIIGRRAETGNERVEKHRLLQRYGTRWNAIGNWSVEVGHRPNANVLELEADNEPELINYVGPLECAARGIGLLAGGAGGTWRYCAAFASENVSEKVHGRTLTSYHLPPPAAARPPRRPRRPRETITWKAAAPRGGAAGGRRGLGAFVVRAGGAGGRRRGRAARVYAAIFRQLLRSTGCTDPVAVCDRRDPLTLFKLFSASSTGRIDRDPST
ncbi:hypothetical protein EVAR_83213_1 [Eumeta japonica]|uniref:Uncharacterized protein n=1 Tax=Eumeta variegata TaxID=151549 RepID=A0A4C1Y645_EUMVA|nr:hypothetical protein EVAR_83213_1 [Eumeta japonica]